MMGGIDDKATVAPFLNNCFQYPVDMSNQLQLCGNMHVESHADPVNYLGNYHNNAFLLPDKCDQDSEAVRQQNLQFTLYNSAFNDKTERKMSIVNHNHVSTGLRLSYGDNEQNSSLTSASGNMTLPVLSSINNDMMREFDRQKEELDHFIRIQEENMAKGVKDMMNRHTASLITAIEKSALKKLREKDVELEAITCRNKELIESMQRATTEAQNWCNMAKYNESVANVLKTNIQQAMQNGNHRREGHGDSEVDDAASCIDPNNYLISTAGGSSAGRSQNKMCRICKSKEVCVLVMPCRHLCLCKECEGFVNACPVCQMIKTAGFEVYLS